jgi:O-antigen/teichoic acid export membrane protein
MSSLARIATRGAGVTLLSQAVRLVLQLGSLVVLTRLLTPAQVGLVAMVTAVINVAEIVRDFGLSSAAIQAPTLSREERGNLFWLNLGLGSACTLTAVVAAPALAALYSEPRVEPVVLALAGLFVISGLNTQYRADLSRGLRFGALALTDVLAQLASVVVAITTAWHGAGYWAIVYQHLTLAAVTCLLNVLQGRWRPGWYRRDVSIRKYIRFGANLLGTNVIGYAVNNVDNVALGAVWGSGSVGLYGRAYQLVQMPLQQVNAPLGRVVLPVLARVVDDAAAYQRYFLRFQLAVCYSLGLAFSLLAGLATPLVAVLFGPQWQAVAPLLMLLAVAGVFRAVDSAAYQLWVSKGLTGRLLRFYLVSRPLMVLAILAGLPWGAKGVATAQLVIAVLHWTIGLWYVCRVADLPWRAPFTQSLRAMAGVLAPAGIVAHLVAAAVDDAVAGVLLGGASGLATAAVLVLLVRPLRRDAAPVLRALRSAASRRAVASQD